METSRAFCYGGGMVVHRPLLMAAGPGGQCPGTSTIGTGAKAQRRNRLAGPRLESPGVASGPVSLTGVK